jgi:hypothetical protein
MKETKKNHPMRHCGSCKVEHNEQTHSNRCAPCRKEGDHARYLAKKIKALRNPDKSVECQRCGTRRLQFRQNGVKTSCKPCGNKWREENAEYLLEYNRKYAEDRRKADPIGARKKLRDWELANPEKRIYSSLRSKVKKFGISVEDYFDMRNAQNNLCAICLQPETIAVPRRSYTKSLAVDHNHDTGKVRGLLCNGCNAGIGYFRDNPESLCRAAEYLTAHSDLCLI